MSGSAEVWLAVVFAVACLFSLPSTAQQRPAGTAPGDLKGGEFVWNPEASPAGPVVVVVSITEQFCYVYRNGIRIAYCPVATGKPGHETPTGVFTILQKDKDHVSSIYHAKMPYTERLTWSGICLHAGSIPGYPNSHGCVHLPLEFSHLLFDLEHLGATVVIADDHSGPAEAAHPGELLSPMLHEDGATMSSGSGGGFLWQPERSLNGPVSLLLSSADRKLYVYRNGVEIGVADLSIADPERPLREGVFTVVDDEAGGVGRPAHRWLRVSAGSEPSSDDGAGEIIHRVRMPPGFVAEVSAVVAPGTTMVITNSRATPDTTTDSDFVIMATQKPDEAQH
jgi:hypothetical protein